MAFPAQSAWNCTTETGKDFPPRGCGEGIRAGLIPSIFQVPPRTGPGGADDLDGTAMPLTFTASPLRSATTEPPETFALGTVSVLVPRRWTLDSGILNSRLATWSLEESCFVFPPNTSVSHTPVHLPTG